MHSFVTSKNAQWRRLIWPTLYIWVISYGTLGAVKTKFALSHWLWSSSLQQCYATACTVIHVLDCTWIESIDCASSRCRSTSLPDIRAKWTKRDCLFATE